MKAAYLTGVRKLEILEVAEPTLENAADVLLRVDVVGVCGSDMHYYRHGRIGSQIIKFPWTVGHEFAGTVMQIGKDVTNLKVGDRVAVDPLIACGKCDQCRTGRVHTCRSQKFLGCPGQAPGAITEYLVMPAHCCFPVPDSVTMVQAALVEPFSIGLYAAVLAGQTQGKRVGILGSGPIGLSVLSAVRARGECTAYMTDIRDYRVDNALKAGADWAGNPRKGDVVRQILDQAPLGLDVVYECAGEQETTDHGAALLGPGGQLVLVGIPEVDRISFDCETMRRRELRVQNVRRQNECVAPAIEMVARKQVDLDAMVTHHFSIQETAKAFDTVADYRDNVVKAMIHISDAK